MFADWELIGIPYRIVIGERSLKEGNVEFQGRKEDTSHQITYENTVNHVTKIMQLEKNKLAV
jgi:prolyl-tRNA synthetase